MGLMKVWAAGVALVLSCSASAVVVQPDTGSITPAPPADAFGKWGNNATAVAVGSNFILTTRHQDGSDQLRSVTFGGVTYAPNANWNQYIFDTGDTDYDVRLIEIRDANDDPITLPGYVELADNPTLNTGQLILIGGFGVTIGDPIFDNGDLTGYEWAGSTNNSNPLNFGQNKLDGSGTISFGGSTSNPRFQDVPAFAADFDELGTGGGSNGAADFEATLGLGDSGGGWFILQDGQWRLIGLSNVIDPSGSAPFGQDLIAARVDVLADQINAVIPEPASLALLSAGVFGLAIRRRR